MQSDPCTQTVGELVRENPARSRVRVVLDRLLPRRERFRSNRRAGSGPGSARIVETLKSLTRARPRPAPTRLVWAWRSWWITSRQPTTRTSVMNCRGWTS